MFDYEKIPFHWVNRLGFLVRKELTSAFRAAEYAISAEEWAILLVLWRKGPQSHSALADVTIKDRTTVTRLIDGMVRKEMVNRAEDSTDRRRSVVALTEYGHSLQGALVPIAQGLITRASAGISPEDLAVTQHTLQKMTENILEAQPRNTKDVGK